MIDNNTLFSIIIPHKNIPDLLVRCLDSIPRREDIQIIVVDDNSDPDKVDFANFPGLNDPYVEVVFGKNENGRKGAGYARNLGLERAKGKWLVFADADDFFTENAFEYLYENKDSECEVIYFKICVYPDILETAPRHNSLIDDFMKSNKVSKEIRYRSYTPWGKMIKRDIVIRKNIRFDEVPAANDIIFSTLVGHWAYSIDVINNVLYSYTVNRKNSITNIIDKDRWTEKYLANLRYNAFLRKHNKKQYQHSIMYYILYSIKLGLPTFFDFIRLAIRYKNNPFNGFTRWISNAYILYKIQK